MNDGPHILIVDDHREMRDLVSRALAKEGFRVSTAGDGKAMRKLMADARVDLILLDLMLPGEDGLSLCRSLRADSDIPIIMLTAKGDEVDRVIGLEMGADDYVPKPFGSRELVARIRAVLRRNRARAPAAGQDKPKRYRFERWTFDVDKRELLGQDGVAVPLSTGEFDLLLALIRRRGAVVSRLELLKEVWGHQAEVMTRTVDIHIAELRRKLEDDPATPRHILTVWKAGYRLEA